MDSIILIAALIICAITICIVIYISKSTKHEKPVNKVHFYVARDKDGKLWLYIGKPVRRVTIFGSPLSHLFILHRSLFNHLGLNENDYDNLKWEDEPVEVFLNMED